MNDQGGSVIRIGLSTAEGARQLGVFPTTLTRWIEQGKLEGFKTPGGHYRVTQEAINRFLTEYPKKVVSAVKEVMVIDDEPDMGIMIHDVLKRTFQDHLKVHTFTNGYAALLQAGKRLPDLVIVDVVMPQFDGFAVCQALRAQPGGEKVELILISGHRTEEATREKTQRLGAVFFEKPLNVRGLADRVGRVLDVARVPA